MSRVIEPLLKSRQERMKEINLRNKEKGRMKAEQRSEAREREAAATVIGHLFNLPSPCCRHHTLPSVACNRSITAKEALSCPTPLMKERPSSAIYPSDSLRQSLLGSRRVRTGLSLAKSVSTNNIAGCEDSPVGLRRILSQSSDSLNFRNRAMSLESLTDEGELYYASLLEDLQEEGRCVCADSWSVAVDHSFLQSQRKDVIKRQDVIYELIQTEFHHVRTLRIMDGVYRRGMLEE
ncbi:hypothetical protein CRUP_019595 [Coryphaenoides rupestris]|nr:hypothetical protein CRUP_019595 [Coryphaenoides rupestris]